MCSEGYSTQFVNAWVQSKTRIKSKCGIEGFDSWISLKLLGLKVTALFAHHNKL